MPKTVVEYVENEHVGQYVNPLDVNYAQGYGISEPSPIERMLKENEADSRPV